jgi:hypothetical protein
VTTRLLPTLYFALAHVALSCAFAAVACSPDSFGGFFYHPRMLAVVHLVTLGWITASILGSLYIVAPLALRTSLKVTWIDYTAFALVTIGVVGMVAHFWLVEYRGMAWSAATAATGILMVGVRTVPVLARAPIPRAIRLHIILAFANIAIASTMGVLLGVNKMTPVLPGRAMDHVFAHAHLAAIGWASMMVVGIGYRLLPMVLPSAMPSGPTLYATAALLEGGLLALFTAFTLHRALLWPGAALLVAGFGSFIGHVLWMLRHPRPRPPAIRRPDPAVLHAGAAFLSLMAACAVGVWLSRAATSAATLRLTTLYGVLGLVGFLAQMVVAMEGRLLPLFAWYWAFQHAGGRGSVLSPHQMPWHPAQLLVAALFILGVPALACGFGLDAPILLRIGALMLLGAALLNATQVAVIVRHAWLRPRLPAGT